MFTPDEIDPWDTPTVAAPPLTFKFATTGSGTVTPPTVPAPVQPDSAPLTLTTPE